MKPSTWRGRLSVLLVTALAASAAVLIGSGVGPAAAADVSPTTNADDGSTGSLRYLLEHLPDADQVVVLPAGSGPYVVGCAEGGTIEINDEVTIVGNDNTIEQTCNGSSVLYTEDSLTVDGVVITGGRSECSGGGIYSAGEDPILTIKSSTITENVAGCGDGGGIYSEGPLVIIESSITNNSAEDDGGAFSNGDEAYESSVTVVRSTIANNCAEDDGGAADLDGPLTLINSTVTGNTSDDQGAIAMDAGELTLVYSDVVSNTLEDGVDCPGLNVMDVGAPDSEVDAEDTLVASNIQVADAGMRTFGSVIALPIDVNQGTPGAFNCRLPDPVVTSSGYNYSDDDTCDLADPTDKQNAADPLLGALAENGGPTQTRLPQTGSPLIDAIPNAACSGGNTLAGSAITTDQRLLPRPDVLNLKCDIGSVEIQTALPVEIQPNFTG